MKTVHKSVLIWYSAEEMFALVTDVESYPQFLPWCDEAIVLSRDKDGMRARIGIAFSGIHQHFTTHNEHVPGREIHMRLVEGPFSRLQGHWTFTPVGDESQRACKVELKLDYAFRSAALAALVGPVFDRIAGSLVDAFVKRAEHVYG
ncbi:type II toxin-antitoxin system RatA family toxin [Ramlibacter sp. AW1]|uniref:Type II toxin-antitoxin system RatA family toxin n=1 Tax=Ramlibacter aurantiacus TaxID=2801330 RepID=A0A937D5I7_9BURK|nr:type II toxin-antitoxin system RatA family toxin [Ramlibacter aurantiacus]MBL0418776.1 type II toxin-antitoxin system RatA family toxin [Ramlibacter aurantiacus]